MELNSCFSNIDELDFLSINGVYSAEYGICGVIGITVAVGACAGVTSSIQAFPQ
jgi:hypothetical protein